MHEALTNPQLDYLKDRWSDIRFMIESGVTEPWTTDFIAALVRTMQPLRVFETGLSIGETSEAIIKALEFSSKMRQKPAYFYGCDTNNDRFVRTKERLQSLIVFTFLKHMDAMTFLDGLHDEWFDVGFIDDWHIKEYVEKEIPLALKKIRPGGILLMHDVYSKHDLYEVCHEHGGVCLPTVPVHAMGSGIGIIEKL